MGIAFWKERTGERGVRKRTRLVRRGARREGLHQQYLARGLPYWLVGLIGSKADAIEMKTWLTTYLQDELKLELSAEKTLIPHATNRVRFLGYDLVRWKGHRIRRTQTIYGARTKRMTEYQLALLLPYDKGVSFAKQ
jgi:hypothetical protein